MKNQPNAIPETPMQYDDLTRSITQNMDLHNAIVRNSMKIFNDFHFRSECGNDSILGLIRYLKDLSMRYYVYDDWNHECFYSLSSLVSNLRESIESYSREYNYQGKNLWVTKRNMHIIIEAGGSEYHRRNNNIPNLVYDIVLDLWEVTRFPDSIPFKKWNGTYELMYLASMLCDIPNDKDHFNEYQDVVKKIHF